MADKAVWLKKPGEAGQGSGILADGNLASADLQA